MCWAGAPLSADPSATTFGLPGTDDASYSLLDMSVAATA
jgi:hypothetical protein